jgi:protein arginine N-methyltransferase 1
MMGDRGRMEPYTEALRRAVQPGSVVIDIGTGTGIFALLACRFGARRVYAIEPDEVIQVAREVAAANGLADRIEFIQEISTRSTIPERADVIISDLRGALPLLDQHIPSIIDARARLLAEGGVMIPRRDTLWVALVNAADLYRSRAGLWEGDDYGLDLRVVRRVATHHWRKARLRPDQLLVPPRCWATLDYATIESPDVCGAASWKIERAGVAHGLLLWFDAEVADGIGFSNAPTAPELIYGAGFFPFADPVTLAAGDAVSVRIQARLADEEYIWDWATRVTDPGDPPRVKASFQQSTFFSQPLSRAALLKRAAGYVPSLNEEGKIESAILALMAAAEPPSLDAIATAICTQFPRRFASWDDALTRVGDLSARFSR